MARQLERRLAGSRTITPLQNGFRLSLRGYASEQDHFWIAREYLGRRVNGVNPAESLMLRKPLGLMPHGGAKLFDADSPAAKLLTDWIAEPEPERFRAFKEITGVSPTEYRARHAVSKPR